MQEAKFSLNVRFNYKGYDSQFTMRDDENGSQLLDKFTIVIDRLEKLGALPERRWEAVKNGNGKEAVKNGNGQATFLEPKPQPEPATPVCRHCESSEYMELLEFTKDGNKRKAWKCQGCEKWHYDKK